MARSLLLVSLMSASLMTQATTLSTSISDFGRCISKQIQATKDNPSWENVRVFLYPAVVACMAGLFCLLVAVDANKQASESNTNN